MSATAGICGAELMGKGDWWLAGVQQYDMDFLPLLATEFVIMGFFETKRYIGFKENGTVRPRPLRSVLFWQGSTFPCKSHRRCCQKKQNCSV